jgi:hypothetical protein
VPCLLWDGRWQTQLRFEGSQVLATRDGRTWRLIARDRAGDPLGGTWFLTPHRSRLSTSGVTGRLQIVVAAATVAGEPVEWTLRVELAV